MSDLLAAPTKILLTGGTSGIGAEMSAQLLRQGHQLVVLARRAGEMRDQPGLVGVACDLSNADALRQSLEEVTAAHPDIAVIINNAALQYDALLTDPAADPARMADEVAINLLAPALIVHALLPAMRARRAPGAIINVTSGLAFFPKERTALYCATKAGLHNMTLSLRYQLEGSGIRVIEAVLPMVDTPMTAGRGTGKMRAADAATAILASLKGRRDEVLIGKSKLIPWLSRLAPAAGRKALRGK